LLNATLVRERLLSRTQVDLDGPRPVDDAPCWNWTGGTTKPDGTGYGQFSVGKRKGILAHRASYELTYGPIAPGLHVDHLCLNKRCVNPAHLEAVTPLVNTQRWADTITECAQGHEYAEASTYITKVGHRMCRICVVERMRARRAAEPRKERVLAPACGKGHEFTPENTYTAPNGHRSCRQCARDRGRPQARKTSQEAIAEAGTAA
jgi:hypothetical protein